MGRIVQSHETGKQMAKCLPSKKKCRYRKNTSLFHEKKNLHPFMADLALPRPPKCTEWPLNPLASRCSPGCSRTQPITLCLCGVVGVPPSAAVDDAAAFLLCFLCFITGGGASPFPFVAATDPALFASSLPVVPSCCCTGAYLNTGSLLILPPARPFADDALRNRRRSLSRHFFLPPPLLFLLATGGALDTADVARFMGEDADSLFTPPASSSLLPAPRGDGAMAAFSSAAANGSKSTPPGPTALRPRVPRSRGDQIMDRADRGDDPTLPPPPPSSRRGGGLSGRILPSSKSSSAVVSSRACAALSRSTPKSKSASASSSASAANSGFGFPGLSSHSNGTVEVTVE
ncbi:hypothetical protein PR202_ga02831 [Eleusine coracana subsp. coracana]|uniref:Uncharacterized protein n=1 Tax=Eleusine coracana subsp. coracana TaxID=191504 RepID=A0AAV5BMT0_ELECO|nr:hypothetical protein PR202_ga02831 [Eleusine coracana subsp. coracana]